MEFEILRDFRGLSDDEFRAESHCYTIINTNSPRQIDIPMAQGLIDFARYGQVSVVTPFTLMGAMALITVEAAMTLSHAEALAAITLTQLVNPGAPVCYGTFTSNVDMKSGSPAFARTFPRLARRRTAGAACRPSMALRQRIGRQHQRRAGSRRDPVRFVGCLMAVRPSSSMLPAGWRAG